MSYLYALSLARQRVREAVAVYGGTFPFYHSFPLDTAVWRGSRYVNDGTLGEGRSQARSRIPAQTTSCPDVRPQRGAGATFGRHSLWGNSAIPELMVHSRH